MKSSGISCVFHYVVPPRSASAGLKFGRFHGEDAYTAREREIDEAANVLWDRVM